MFDQKSTESINPLPTTDCRQRNYTIARNRLDDNLQWRCSVCQSVVPTHETHLHLNSCLDINSAKEPNSPLLALSNHQFFKELICIAISPMDKNDRPRTKRLERPSPNVKHPIIISKKSKELDSDIKECIKGINKCQTKPPINSRRKAPEVSQNSMSSTNDLLCQRCDTKIDKNLNSRQFFTTNKMNLNERMKSENRFQKSISKEETNCMNETTNAINKSDNKTTQTRNKCKEYSETTINTKNAIQWTPEEQINIKTEDKNEEKEKAINESKEWNHFKSQLIPCSLCCRTFFPHRLPVHEKSCRGAVIGVKKGMKTKPESKVNVRTNLPIKSTFLDCNTCGRKYSTTSLTLHELKCRTNILNRRLSTGKGENVNELSTAWEHFKSQLVACSKCNRKFLSDRLEKHEPNCKASPVFSTKSNDK